MPRYMLNTDTCSLRVTPASQWALLVLDVIESKKFVAAGPVSRIRRAALQTDNLFEISRFCVTPASQSMFLPTNLDSSLRA